MKILVTGSTGFIGAALCRALLAAGNEVRAFHRPTSTLRLIEDLPVEHCLGNLTQPETLEAALQGIQLVYHAGALVGGPEEPGRIYAVIVEGTRSLLQAARQAGVERIVYTSSAASLGIPEDMPLRSVSPRNRIAPVRINENHTWNYAPERWPYAYAKYMAELEVQRAVAMGMDAVIVNPTVVVGPGDIYRQASSTIVQVARQRIPALVEGGLNVVHLSDVIAGHLAAAERGRSGQRYLLAGENLTIIEFLRKIARIAGVLPPLVLLPSSLVRALAGPSQLVASFIDLPASSSTLRLAGRYFYYDNRKAQVELGLKPPRPVDEAIQDAYNWFVSTGALSPRRTTAKSISID